MEIERTLAWKRANQQIQKEASSFWQSTGGGYGFHQTPERSARKEVVKMLYNEPAYLESPHYLLWDSIFFFHAVKLFRSQTHSIVKFKNIF